MSILLIGSQGSMGLRYQAILKSFGTNYFRMEKDWSDIKPGHIKEQVEGIIIATPTDTHEALLKGMIRYQKPILVEKPVTKDVSALREILDQFKEEDIPLEMMLQYQALAQEGAQGVSYYDYFRHGNDGLVWDCLQVIALAHGPIYLDEKSPIWKCAINSHVLNIQSMDLAYMLYLREWLDDPVGDLGRILEIHEKVAEFKQAQGEQHGGVHSCGHRHTGALDESPLTEKDFRAPRWQAHH